MRFAIRIPSHVEEGLRSILLAFSLLVAVCSVALADPTVAGDWRADLGQGVRIDMNVTPDGNWSSETREGNRLVRKMRGTYQQSQSSVRSGELVFTPIQTSSGNDGAKVETDQYQMAENGRELRLTSEGDTIVFKKR